MGTGDTPRGRQAYDVIVLGVGSVGASACYHLARRGLRVLGLDQFDIPNTNGAHHGRTRMIRQSYFEHPDYVPLLRRAYQLWHGLQRSDRRQFFHITGGVYLGREDGTIVPGSRRAAAEHALDHEMLSRREVSLRFPTLRPLAHHVGFYESRAGLLVPELAVAAHANAARAHGAELRARTRATAWRSSEHGVEVSTAAATFRASHLVLAAGAWSGPVAADLGIRLEVTRQVLAWFEPCGDPSRFAPGAFPCWFAETEPPFGHYGFPLLPGDPGLKIALHRPGEAIDPSAPVDPPRDDEIEALRSTFDRIFPGCAGRLAEACTCKYTSSPDGQFVVGRHPHQPRVSLACGLSGHGFKFASVLGEALADLASRGETSLPIGFLSPARFGAGPSLS